MSLSKIKRNSVHAVFVDASGTILRGAYDTPMGVEVYPDALPLLQAMRARKLKDTTIRTGLITNWGRRIGEMLRALQISDCFDVVVSSDDVTHAKPDSEIFLRACSLADVLPKHSFHLGDSLYDDVLGAQNAGLEAIWINRFSLGGMTSAERDTTKQLRNPFFEDMSAAFQFLKSIA